MSKRREFMNYIGTGAIGGMVGYYVGAQGLLGIQSDENPTESQNPDVSNGNERDSADSSDTTGESFQDDFEYQGDSLSENGWEPQNSSIQASNSYLTTSSNETEQFIYRQVSGFSEIELTGVQNNERIKGFRIFLSESRDLKNGIGMNVEQDRNTQNFDYGSVKIDGEDVGFSHQGELHNYRIVKNSNGTVELYINGSQFTQISNVDEVDFSYLAIRFDGSNQRIDSISYTA